MARVAGLDRALPEELDAEAPRERARARGREQNEEAAVSPRPQAGRLQAATLLAVVVAVQLAWLATIAYLLVRLLS